MSPAATYSSPKARGKTATPKSAATNRKQADRDDDGNREISGPTRSNNSSRNSRNGRVLREYVKIGRARYCAWVSDVGVPDAQYHAKSKPGKSILFTEYSDTGPNKIAKSISRFKTP